MAEDSGDIRFVPVITWSHDLLVWRGDSQMESDTAFEAASQMAARLSPAVTIDERPALSIVDDTGEQHKFPLQVSVFAYRSEFMTPLRRACQVIAELNYDAEPEHAFVPVVVSGEHVIWRPYWRSPWRSRVGDRDWAQEKSAEVLHDQLRPAACHERERGGMGGAWEAAIERTEDGAVLTDRIAGDTFPTKALAWSHAAKILAEAEATAQPAPERTPLVTIQCSPSPESPCQ